MINQLSIEFSALIETPSSGEGGLSSDRAEKIESVVSRLVELHQTSFQCIIPLSNDKVKKKHFTIQAYKNLTALAGGKNIGDIKKHANLGNAKYNIELLNC